MEILFIGGNFFKSMENEIIKNSKSVIQYAANKFEWNLIEGLSLHQKINLKILSAILIGSYPRDYKKLLIKNRDYKYKNLIKCKYVKFCNAWGYKNISRANSLKKEIKNNLDNTKENKVVIVYSSHTPFLQAAVYAKKINPSIKICLIVPDLPQYINLRERQSLVYKILKKIDIRIFNKNLKYVDSFVLLTKEMKDILNVGKRDYVIVEGLVNKRDVEEIKILENKSNVRKIVYTGNINRRFGIDKLVQAFLRLKERDLELVICGKGDYERNIKNYALKDKRIKYLGQIKNTEAVRLQQNATILVNPRQGEEEFTKYSFPSKNMEYLLAGRPVIAYKLQGIPDEYDDYIFYVEDNSVESLKNKIQEVLNLSTIRRNEFGNRARKFVLENKNNEVVAGKILEMLKSV
ncbi:glycosyltransferase [Fusobacterium sp. MFO224]|uniref:glycosyltransferase n=1 Tax=Fusobacterium sp. MFO224 TaxID=3378070 RepID=UPI0038531047